MSYEQPTVVDLGELKDLTLASGQIGSPDGVGFTVQVTIPDDGSVADVSVGVFP